MTRGPEGSPLPQYSGHSPLAVRRYSFDGWTLSTACGDREHARCSAQGCRYLEPCCPRLIRSGGAGNRRRADGGKLEPARYPQEPPRLSF